MPAQRHVADTFLHIMIDRLQALIRGDQREKPPAPGQLTVNRIFKKLPVKAPDKCPDSSFVRGTFTFFPAHQRIRFSFHLPFYFLNRNRRHVYFPAIDRYPQKAPFFSRLRQCRLIRIKGQPRVLNKFFNLPPVFRKLFLRLRKDDNIVGISGIQRSPRFKPGVHLLQIHIGKKRRQRHARHDPLFLTDNFSLKNHPFFQKKTTAEIRFLRILSKNLLKHGKQPVHIHRVKVIVYIHLIAVQPPTGSGGKQLPDALPHRPPLSERPEICRKNPIVPVHPPCRQLQQIAEAPGKLVNRTFFVRPRLADQVLYRKGKCFPVPYTLRFLQIFPVLHIFRQVFFLSAGEAPLLPLPAQEFPPESFICYILKKPQFLSLPHTGKQPRNSLFKIRRAGQIPTRRLSKTEQERNAFNIRHPYVTRPYTLRLPAQPFFGECFVRRRCFAFFLIPSLAHIFRPDTAPCSLLG